MDDQNDHDINSVAGVLKLYFRGLENPLFPKERFLDLISTTSESPSRKTSEICKDLCFVSSADPRLTLFQSSTLVQKELTTSSR